MAGQTHRSYQVLDESPEPMLAVKERASQVAGKAAEAWDATRGQAEHIAADISDVTVDAWESTRDFVRRYPVVAIGVGFALSFLLFRMMHHESAMTRRMSRYSA